MARNKKRGRPADVSDPSLGIPVLPKDALERINLGQSFAEYDRVLLQPNVFVRTPAYLASCEPDRSRCFFVGRRGTGKTAITEVLQLESRHTAVVHPEIFTISEGPVDPAELGDTHQKPFRSLISALRRAVEQQLLLLWLGDGMVDGSDLPSELQRDLRAIPSTDFDERASKLIEEMLAALKDDPLWRALRSKAKRLSALMGSLDSRGRNQHTIAFDRVDENWDGTDAAVMYLTALMHACLQVNGDLPWGRALVFLRENVFERVRLADSEFARLETAVVGLDWTQEQLTEMIERRFNLPFNTRIRLGGPTWAAYFENGESAKDTIFGFCQNRPRDVITFSSLALETAISRKHQRILPEDLDDAKRRFSDSRLKDLGDEYAENYPQVALVLSKFYGVGQRFTIAGLEGLLHAILDDNEVQRLCATWIYSVSTPELFARLLYGIGFVGFANGSGSAVFRSLGPKDTTPPPLSEKTDILVHPSYHLALDLQDRLVTGAEGTIHLQRVGIVGDLPGSLTPEEYDAALEVLEGEIKDLKPTRQNSDRFEELVKETVELCFFRSLNNVELRSRNVDGSAIRDVVASNRSHVGFWGMVREKYGATQIPWECKNYKNLKSSDFHQMSYYMNDTSGKFIVAVFRGDSTNKTYIGHVRRIANEKKGLILLLTERDLLVFIRQTRKGKIKEDHLLSRYDYLVRQIS